MYCIKPSSITLLLYWSLFQYEPDCPGYPTERYTVDIDGVQIADEIVHEFQSLSTNHRDGSVTLSLPLTQPLPENATTVNMTKFNTVPTDMSDDMGNIVTEMVTWRTSAVFGELKVPIAGAQIRILSKVAPIIGSAIGIGQYWVSVTLSVIGFFLRPLPIMSPRARDICQ